MVLLGTKSKAFFISKKAARTDLWTSKEANQGWVTLRIASSVETREGLLCPMDYVLNILRIVFHLVMVVLYCLQL